MSSQLEPEVQVQGQPKDVETQNEDTLKKENKAQGTKTFETSTAKTSKTQEQTPQTNFFKRAAVTALACLISFLLFLLIFPFILFF